MFAPHLVTSPRAKKTFCVHGQILVVNVMLVVRPFFGRGMIMAVKIFAPKIKNANTDTNTPLPQ